MINQRSEEESEGRIINALIGDQENLPSWENQSFDRAKGSSSNRDCSLMKLGDICEKWLYCTGTQYERSYQMHPFPAYVHPFILLREYDSSNPQVHVSAT